MGRIVLHIGMERTGSAALQRFFSRHRAALRMMGVRYPRSRSDAGSEKHQELVDAVHGGPAGDAVRAHAGAAARAALTVLSAEGLSAADPAFAAALAPLAEAGPVQVIVYLRRQDEWALSAFRAAIVAGDAGVADGIAAWLAGAEVRMRLDYAAILGYWAGVFGADAVTVRLYPHDLPLVPGFLRAAGLPPAAHLLPDGNRRVNEGVSDNVLRAALADLGAEPVLPSLDQAARDGLLSAFVEGNETIRRQYLPQRKTLFGIN